MDALTQVTYRDLLQHLIEFVGGVPQAVVEYKFRQAVRQGYRNVCDSNDKWDYFYKYQQLTFNIPYSTGTIDYTNSTRRLVLTGGTWPSWAANGHVRLGNYFVRVASLLNGTTLVLDSSYAPGQNVLAGTSYTLYQSSYTLPADMRSLFNPQSESTWLGGQHIEPNDWHTLERQIGSGGQPLGWTVMPDDHLPNRFAVFVFPYPIAAITYAFVYQRSPRPLFYCGYDLRDSGDSSSGGTISVTGGSATVTGSGTNFAANMVGSVFRYSATAATQPDGEGGPNPYVEQHVITAVDTVGQTLTLNDVIGSANYAGVAWNVSDPVDYPDRMLNAVYRSIEYQGEILRKDNGNVGLRDQLWDKALKLALENDVSDVTRSVAQRPIGFLASNSRLALGWQVQGP